MQICVSGNEAILRIVQIDRVSGCSSPDAVEREFRGIFGNLLALTA
ncbi:hypothetical protein [Horticoccus sp. 23ND18S-11]